MKAELTERMWRALEIASTGEGWVCASGNVRKGTLYRVSNKTIDALIARGYLTPAFDAYGGMAGRLTDAGREALAAR